MNGRPLFSAFLTLATVNPSSFSFPHTNGVSGADCECTVELDNFKICLFILDVLFFIHLPSSGCVGVVLFVGVGASDVPLARCLGLALSTLLANPTSHPLVPAKASRNLPHDTGTPIFLGGWCLCGAFSSCVLCCQLYVLRSGVGRDRARGREGCEDGGAEV